MVWILIWNIWKRLKVTVWGPLPRYANATLKHDKDSIYCALLNPQWKQSLTSNSVEVGDTWSLKCSIAGLDRQIRNFAPILIITEAKNANFFMCKRTEFVHEELRDFVKMTLARLSSHWLWLESSHSVKNVTRFGSSHRFLNVTRVESETPKIVTRVESLTRVTLSVVCSRLDYAW